MGVEDQVQAIVSRHVCSTCDHFRDLLPLFPCPAGAVVGRHAAGDEVAFFRLRIGENEKWRAQRGQKATNFADLLDDRLGRGAVTEGDGNKGPQEAQISLSQLLFQHFCVGGKESVGAQLRACITGLYHLVQHFLVGLVP